MSSRGLRSPASGPLPAANHEAALSAAEAVSPAVLDTPEAWWAETGTAGANEGCNRPFWLRHDAIDYVRQHGGYVAPLYRKRAAERIAICIIPNCGGRAPAGDAFCAKHRDRPTPASQEAGHAE